MTLVRRKVELISAGLNEAAADLGGMLPGESLELQNAYFDTPSTCSVRKGSADGDDLLDDQGSPANITSVPFFKYFPSQGSIVVIGHSTVTDKHYLYDLDTAAKNKAGGGTPVPPIILPTSGAFSWDTALPFRVTGAAWYNRKFYFSDIAGVQGMLRYNGDTGVVDYPLFTLGSGPAAPLRPRKLFNHANHIISLGYGDENTPYAADLLRSCVIGDPDQWEASDFVNVGNTEEPLIDGLSVGDFAILFKAGRIFRMSGGSALNWAFTEIDPDRGAVGERASTYFDDFVWFLSPEGMARTGLKGPSELFVDKVKMSFASWDNFENCWVDVNVPERMIVFACHEAGESGSYPTLLVQVDVRSGNFVVREYLDSSGVYQSFHGDRVPQVAGVPPGLGPSGPPTIQAASAIGLDGWTGNWTNGDVQAETTTRHESRNMDESEGFAQDASEASGVTSTVLTGKESGALYEERVRHERNAIFSTYSPAADGQEVKTLADAPTINITGASAGGITLSVFNPNQPGVGAIEIYQALHTDDVCPIVAPSYSLIKTLTNPGEWEYPVIGGIVCDLQYQFRAKWVRSGWADSAWSNIQCVRPCTGGA
jgi:hypothetical protein